MLLWSSRAAKITVRALASPPDTGRRHVSSVPQDTRPRCGLSSTRSNENCMPSKSRQFMGILEHVSTVRMCLLALRWLPGGELARMASDSARYSARASRSQQIRAAVLVEGAAAQAAAMGEAGG